MLLEHRKNKSNREISIVPAMLLIVIIINNYTISILNYDIILQNK